MYMVLAISETLYVYYSVYDDQYGTRVILIYHIENDSYIIIPYNVHWCYALNVMTPITAWTLTFLAILFFRWGKQSIFMTFIVFRYYFSFMT